MKTEELLIKLSTDIQSLTVNDVLIKLPELEKYYLEKNYILIFEAFSKYKNKLVLDCIDDPIIKYWVGTLFYFAHCSTPFLISSNVTLGIAYLLCVMEDIHLYSHLSGLQGEVAWVIGSFYLEKEKGRFSESLQYLKLGAELGNNNCKLWMGIKHFGGIRGERLYNEEAYRLFMDVAKFDVNGGNIFLAYYFLGLMHQNGDGRLQNYFLAFLYYSAAALQSIGKGNLDGRFILRSSVLMYTHNVCYVGDLSFDTFMNTKKLQPLFDLKDLSSQEFIQLGEWLLQWPQFYKDKKINDEQFNFATKLFQKIFTPTSENYRKFKIHRDSYTSIDNGEQPLNEAQKPAKKLAESLRKLNADIEEEGKSVIYKLMSFSGLMFKEKRRQFFSDSPSNEQYFCKNSLELLEIEKRYEKKNYLCDMKFEFK